MEDIIYLKLGKGCARSSIYRSSEKTVYLGKSHGKPSIYTMLVGFLLSTFRRVEIFFFIHPFTEDLQKLQSS